MKVKKAEFLRYASHKKDFLAEGYPEIALVGRSNVGKSSLINTLVGQKNLARTSNTPGKTRAVHFYLVNDSFYLVDLPGYGYARVSRQMQQKWTFLIEE
jgi:GTP-binding protein